MELLASNSKKCSLVDQRIFSVLIYGILVKFNVSRGEYEPFFKRFHLLSVKNCNIYFDNIISDELSGMFESGKGGKELKEYMIFILNWKNQLSFLLMKKLVKNLLIFLSKT